MYFMVLLIVVMRAIIIIVLLLLLPYFGLNAIHLCGPSEFSVWLLFDLFHSYWEKHFLTQMVASISITTIYGVKTKHITEVWWRWIWRRGAHRKNKNCWHWNWDCIPLAFLLSQLQKKLNLFVVVVFSPIVFISRSAGVGHRI